LAYSRGEALALENIGHGLYYHARYEDALDTLKMACSMLATQAETRLLGYCRLKVATSSTGNTGAKRWSTKSPSPPTCCASRVMTRSRPCLQQPGLVALACGRLSEGDRRVHQGAHHPRGPRSTALPGSDAEQHGHHPLSMGTLCPGPGGLPHIACHPRRTRWHPRSGVGQ
jgi:hypothetical protein